MGDEFDRCECIWSHELAMQRLLNFIRRNQDHCTDTECIDVPGHIQPGHRTQTGGNEDGGFTMMTMFMIFAVIMYFIRPESIRNFANTKLRRPKGQDSDNGNDPPPPAPPAVN